MLKLIAFFLITLTFLYSCEKEETMKKEIVREIVRDTFLVVGDTSKCNHIKNNQSQVLAPDTDSLDFDYDSLKDIVFVHSYEVFDNTQFCNEYLSKCPPEYICDCWDWWVDKLFCLYIPNEIQILMKNNDSFQDIEYNDTLSNKGLWLTKGGYIELVRDNDNDGLYRSDTSMFGLRKISNCDTIYGWIKVVTFNHSFELLEMTSQD